MDTNEAEAPIRISSESPKGDHSRFAFCMEAAERFVARRARDLPGGETARITS